MRKFKFQPMINGKKYTHELRQYVVDHIESRLQNSNLSLSQVCNEIPEVIGISRASAHRWYNALGNAAGGKLRNNFNVKPILDKDDNKSPYTEEFRKSVMEFAMRFGVPSAGKRYKVCNESIYDWIKAYGWSTAYFNR